MSTISIEWLSDYSECDTCGGNYADGAQVTIDGEVVLDLQPVAHCFGGDDYDERMVWKLILKHLGHTVEGDDGRSRIGYFEDGND